MQSSSWKLWLTAPALALCVGLAGAGAALAEHTFEVVKSLELPDGGASALVVGSDGALYGTTASGGPSNKGRLFRIDAEGTASALYSFDGTEGSGRSGLVLGSDGAFYGTTAGGGSSGQGTVFRIDTAGILTTLHSFDGDDGAQPTSLILGSDGALYGTTPQGGSFGWGTVFRIDSAGFFKSLHSFSDSDGESHFGPLTLGSDGALYGVARNLSGSPSVGGTIFRIGAAGAFTTVYSSDEAEFRPNGPLTLGSDGALYGTMESVCYGPWTCPDGFGSIFRVDNAGSLTTVRSFDGSTGSFGLTPTNRLVLGSDGALYGTTLAGGFYGAGTLFRIDQGFFQVLHAFQTLTPLSRAPVFVVASDDAVYGTTVDGQVFKVNSAGRFLPLEEYGWPELIVGSDGAIYGSQGSRIFRIDASGASTTRPLLFPPSADGSHPLPVLALGGDGAIYGATSGGLFKLDSSGAFTSLHAFGDDTVSSLVRGNDGAVYGSTGSRVFRIDSTGTFTSLQRGEEGVFPVGNGTLYGFFSNSAFAVVGAGNVTTLINFDNSVYLEPLPPIDALALGSDGAFYGSLTRNLGCIPCTLCCSPDYHNVFFRIDGAGAFTSLLDDWLGASALVRGSDGAFYGTTDDTLFRIDGAGILTTLHSFTGIDGAGASPALVLGNDGALYGTTSSGGASGVGTVFKLDGAGTFTSLHSFSGADGSYPRDDLLLGSDGSLYGTTESGGASGVGTVFRVDSAGVFSSLHSYSTAYDFSSGALVVANDCSLYGTAAGGPSGGGIVYRLFEARPPCQSIDFDPPADHFFGEPPFSANATATSGLPVSLRASGPCSVSGDSVTLTGVGRCTLTASQGGDVDYEPAPSVAHIFDVRPAACFDGLDNDSDGSADFGSDPDCSSAIDTNENGAPVAICQSVTLAAVAGTCGASASVDGGSSDPDGHALDVAQSPAGPYALGATPVTLQVADPFGGGGSCQALVTVSDETPPTIDCGPALLPRQKGVASLPWSATDTCSPVLAQTTPPTCFLVKKNGRQVERRCDLLSSAELSFRKLPKPRTHVAWTVTARDAAGNEVSRRCETVIGKRRR